MILFQDRLEKEKAAEVMSVTSGGKSNPNDGAQYTRIDADLQEFAAAIDRKKNGGHHVPKYSVPK